jgi:hypothetical protein
MNGSPFFREDLTKYENRINWSLLGCLSINALRSRILERLGLGSEGVFQQEHVEGQAYRPDFAVYYGNQRIAYIEVELNDRDVSQGKNYEENLKEPVHWIVGQPNCQHDLSLKEIAEIAVEVAKTADPQTRANLLHLQLVIEDGLTQVKALRSVKRSLPPWFLNHPGLVAIQTAVQPLIDDGHIQNWNFNRAGLSLRLVRMSQDVVAGRLGFALIAANSRDTETILVPTATEIKKRLRRRLQEWGSHYADLITRMLVNSVREPRGNGRERVSVKVFDEHHDDVAKLFDELVSALKQAPV